jgi:nucleoid-associated protein YgaU
LIEAERDLPIGKYIFRVHVLAPDGIKVIARASVPFEREAGEAIAAVAPSGRGETAQDVAAAFKTTAPKLEKADGAVIIRRGDTLWRISRRVYGLGIRYSAIYLANQAQITDPDRIWPGQVFRLPEKTPEGESADLTTTGRQAASKF